MVCSGGLLNWFAEHCVFSLLATKLHRVFKKCTVTISVTRNMYEAVGSSTDDKQRLFLASVERKLKNLSMSLTQDHICLNFWR